LACCLGHFTELLLQYKYRFDGPGKHRGGISLTAVFSI
jgi:hypothetical protein